MINSPKCLSISKIDLSAFRFWLCSGVILQEGGMDGDGQGPGWPGNARGAQGQGQAPAVPKKGPHPNITKPPCGHSSESFGAAGLHLRHPWKHPGKAAVFI